jgi:hypothetical protein
LLHTWTAQLVALLPTARVTQVRPLALFVLGVLWTEGVALRRVAATLPLPVADASIEQRLRRWLANPRVDVRALWRGLLPDLLASRAGQQLLVVLDPTPHTAVATILELGLVCRRRTVPLAWRVVPQQTGWPRPQLAYFVDLITEVAAALPAGCTVTLLGDRALPSAELLDACRAVGWEALFRLSTDARQGYTVRLPGGTTCPLWDLVTGPGQRWAGEVALFQKAGWRRLHLTIHWATGQDAPWLLLSTRPGGADRVREYRCRAHAEATYEDRKSRGFGVEASRIRDLARLDRLLLVVALALGWGMQLGLRAIRRGERHRYDRRGPRALSVVRIGWAALADALDRRMRPPPLPFHDTAHGPVFTWLA